MLQQHEILCSQQLSSCPKTCYTVRDVRVVWLSVQKAGPYIPLFLDFGFFFLLSFFLDEPFDFLLSFSLCLFLLCFLFSLSLERRAFFLDLDGLSSSSKLSLSDSEPDKLNESE